MVIESSNLSALKNFSVMVEEGSLVRAADKLNLDRSALSKQFKKLEDDFGRKLYNSSERTGVKLTPAGEILYKGIKRALNILMLTEKEMNEADDISLGKISLAISRDIQKYYMLNILNEFMEQNDNLKIKFISSNYKDADRKIREYNIDIIIDEVDTQSEIKNCKFISILEDDYVLVYNPSLSLEQTESLPMILPIKENFSRTKIVNYLTEKEISYNIKYELSDFETIVEFIKTKKAVSIIPHKVAEDNGLNFRCIKGLKYKVSLLYNEENLTKSTQTFIDFIKKNY